MGLKIAVKAHSEGDLALAEQHYKEHTSKATKIVYIKLWRIIAINRSPSSY